jgi:O-antigen ligase
VGIAALALAIFSTAFVVDTGADSAFDAPKRLFCLLLVAVAAATLTFEPMRWPLARQSPLFTRLAFWLTTTAFALTGVSALVSPRAALARAAFRAVFLYALLLPIGASMIVKRGRIVLLAAFVSVTAVNAVVSILQSARLYQPFQLLTESARESTGAFAGSVGLLSVTLALASVAALAVCLNARGAVRAAAGLCVLVFLAALLLNRNLTSLSALSVGVTVLLFARYGQRSLPGVLLSLTVLAAGIALSPMRIRAADVRAAAVAGDWDAVTSYRIGAWKAASAMARERPATGYGPGTYAAEFVPHRLAVEIAAHRRYINPLLTSSYGEAHCDYLQVFAEAGIPAGIAALGAFVCLFISLSRRLRSENSPARAETELLIAFLAAGATAALTWFPLQRPITALPLLVAAGRAWRIGAERQTPPAEPQPTPRSFPWAARGIALLLLAGTAWPELPRYAGERALRYVSDGLTYVLKHPTGVGDPQKTLAELAARARAAATALPGDPRPWILAGGAHLVKGEPGVALERYRAALADGERSETDLNMARAREGLGQTEEAHRAFLRSAWISPRLLRVMLPDVAEPVRQELRDLEARLESGQLKQPPPPPE